MNELNEAIKKIKASTVLTPKQKQANIEAIRAFHATTQEYRSKT